MPLIAGIELLIQFCFAFHVLKTGRPYWWIFIIMSFPVFGCIIYYFVEVFPGSREQRNANRTARKLAKALRPDADLKRRAEELAICGSVDNRMSLAEECMNCQMYGEAEKLYESCLTGAFQSDAAILFGWARASVENRSLGKAKEAIARLRSAAPKYRPLEVRLLEARLFEGLDQRDEAGIAYQELIPAFVGLEARFRYAEFLSQADQHESALNAYREVVAAAQRHPSSLEEEQRWAKAARQAIAAAGAGK